MPAEKPYSVGDSPVYNIPNLVQIYSAVITKVSGIGSSFYYILKALRMVYRQGDLSMLRLFAALRILFFPKAIYKVHSLGLMTKLSNPARKLEPLYFLSHKHYISRYLTLRQRVQIAIDHHEYEFKNYNREYAAKVYHSGGALLWERTVNNHNFTIELDASDDNRHEGDLSVILSVDGDRLCRMSFCYLDANIFGTPSHMTLLISRNQTDRTPMRTKFDQAYKQNTPQFFCLAAVCGIAIANDFMTILAIKHDAQIGYEANLDFGFRNSYTLLWEKFDSVAVEEHVYMLNVPLTLRPLRMVNGAHRRRAHNRRRHWDDILESARSGMINYRNSRQVLS
jgi:hypothetical protein